MRCRAVMQSIAAPTAKGGPASVKSVDGGPDIWMNRRKPHDKDEDDILY